MENQTPQVPTANSSQTTAEQSEKAVARSPLAMSSVVIIILLGLLLLSLSVTGYFYYQLQKVNNDLRILNDELTQKQTETTIPTTEPVVTNETTNWKTYTTKKLSQVSFPAVSLNYPSTWKINEENNGTDFMNLKLTKDGYEVALFQAGMGGSVCLFDDSPEFIGPSSDYKSLKYTEINAKSGTLRYFISPTQPKTIQFCMKSNDLFASFGLGALRIDLPTIENKNTFNEAVEVVKTISPI